jgi:GT2 family glycosyltransferase
VSVSLAIATYNRSAVLAKSLARLAELTVPDEIVIVDDGSDDGCEDMVGSLDLPIRYIYNNRPYFALVSQARNVGLRAATGDLFVTCEPEVLFESDALAQLVAAYEANPDKAVNAGSVTHVHEDGSRETVRGWTASFCTLFRRDWLLAVNGWDEEMPGIYGHDDCDLTTRLGLAGHGTLVDESIRVTHQWHPSTRAVEGAEDDLQANGRYLRSKEIGWGLPVCENPPIIANADIEWGKVIHRAAVFT